MNKKYIAPILISALILIYCIGITILFAKALTLGVPLWVFLILLIGPLVTGIVIVIVLIQRIKEIKGGEENEASKY